MRSIFALAPLLVAGTASAAPLAPLPRELPATCAPLAVVPKSSIETPTFSAHVSVANCLAEVGMNRAALTVEDLEHAVAPSLAIFDDVIRNGDPAWRLVAEDAKRDTYASMIVRLRATKPTDAVLAPWQHQVETSEVAMRELVRAHPDLVRTDPVIANIVHDHDLVAHAR